MCLGCGISAFNGRVTVELEAVEALAPIGDRIVLTYLGLSDCQIGLLLNIRMSVPKQGIERSVLAYREMQKSGLWRRRRFGF